MFGALYGLAESLFHMSSKIMTGINLADLWSQQDGATCHIACVTIDLLEETLIKE